MRTLWLLLPLTLGLASCGTGLSNALTQGAGLAAAGQAAAALQDGVARITASELQTLQAKGEKVVIVDVRNAASFESSHVQGAVNVLGDAVASNQAKLPKDSTIVTYCTCVNEGGAAKAAKSLMELGYPKVFALKDGLDGWKAAGGAIAEAPATPAP